MDEREKKRFELWKKCSEEEINTALILLKKKRKHPPITHNLKYLAKKIELELTEERENFLIEATAFNIEARYPDEESLPPEYSYVKQKYDEAMEILKWLRKKSEE